MGSVCLAHAMPGSLHPTSAVPARIFFPTKKLNSGSTSSLNLYYIVFVSVLEAFRSPMFRYMILSGALINLTLAAEKKVGKSV